MSISEGITEFIIKHGEGLYGELRYSLLREAIEKHLDYKTVIVLEDKKGIKAVCRFNFLTPYMVYVIDLVVRKDARGFNVIKEVVEECLELNPVVKYFSFERGLKGPKRKRRVYKIFDILKRRD